LNFDTIFPGSYFHYNLTQTAKEASSYLRPFITEVIYVVYVNKFVAIQFHTTFFSGKRKSQKCSFAIGQASGAGVNFISILPTPFLSISFYQNVSKPNVTALNFWRQNFVRKMRA